jgi:Uma2 family endonuclease
MSAVSPVPCSNAEEFAKLPDNGQRRELVRGVIHVMSPAGGRHGQIALRLGAMLLQHVEAHDLGGVFAAETGFLLTRNPDTVRAPDVAYVERKRMDTLDDLAGFIPLAPDLVAEVISRNDSFSHVEEKTRFWLTSGVRVVLVVDPQNRTLRVVRGPDESHLLDETAELTVDDVVPGWRISVNTLFCWGPVFRPRNAKLFAFSEGETCRRP